MNKRKLLKQKMDALQKQYDELALEEQKKAGALIINLYEEGKIQDEYLKTQIAKILGEHSDVSKHTTLAKADNFKQEVEIRN